MPCGIKAILLEFAKNNKFIFKKLDIPVKKKPNPPRLIQTAQKRLLNRREPSIYDRNILISSCFAVLA